MNFKIHQHGNSTPKSTDDQISSQETINLEGNIPFANLDEYPTYPGCSGDNEDIRACFHKSMQMHINKKFNADLAKNLNLSPGLKKIYAQLRISKTGKIEAIGSRAPHESLNEEMNRVINLYPKVTPGKFEGKEVDAIYMIPVTFNVE